MKQRYVISPWLFTVYIDVVTKKSENNNKRIGVRCLRREEENRNCFWLLYPDDLVLYSGSEEVLKALVARCVECGKEGSLKVNIDNNRMTVLVGAERSMCEMFEDGTRLEHVSEFKCLRCALDK